MKTSIATVSLSGTLSEKLDAIAATKCDAVEIFENDLRSWNGGATRATAPPMPLSGLLPRHGSSSTRSSPQSEQAER